MQRFVFLLNFPPGGGYGGRGGAIGAFGAGQGGTGVGPGPGGFGGFGAGGPGGYGIGPGGVGPGGFGPGRTGPGGQGTGMEHTIAPFSSHVAEGTPKLNLSSSSEKSCTLCLLTSSDLYNKWKFPALHTRISGQPLYCKYCSCGQFKAAG